MGSHILHLDGQIIDIDRQLMEISRAECEEDFAMFVRQAWHVIEPGQPYIHGWHIDFLCEHLTAITDGVELDSGALYNRLLINVPPGTMKSLLVGVFWPAWEWGPRNLPHHRFVCASHSLDLSIRDGLRMRRLVTSEWYQERWGDRVQLTGDQNQKTKFENTSTGFRQAAASGSITGARGDRVVIDDPHSVDGANSDAMRDTTVQWFKEAVPTRLNNPDRSAIVVVMQRLHQGDVSGVILDEQLGYDHIMLPMEYDPTRATPTLLGLEDPRTEDCELLFPERFSAAVVERDKKVMGPYAAAGQFQQEPTPRGGGIIKPDWWETWVEEGWPPIDYVVASLDTAYTTKTENDYSALTIWGIFSGDINNRADNFVSARSKRKNVADEASRFDEGVRISQLLDHNPESVPRVMLMAAWQERLEMPDLVRKVIETCTKFKVDTLLVEAKASGISVSQELRRLYNNEDFGVHLINPGAIDKLSRLYSVQHLFSEGIVYAPDRHWSDMVIRQCEIFPKGKHDDLCLVGETSIAMADGACRPLSEITNGEMVATPAGPRRVLASGMTGTQQIWRLEFAGGFLEGTGNHPVFVDGQWKELASLCPSDTLTLYQPNTGASWLSRARTALSLRRLSSMGINTDATQMQKTLRIAATLAARATGFIGMCGNFITGQSLMAIKSITLTATPATMTSPTLSACHSKPIGPSTTAIMSPEAGLRSNWSILPTFAIFQRIGIKARLDVNGIAKMLTRLSAPLMLLSRTAKATTLACVSGAAQALKLGALKSLCVQLFALTKNPNTCAVEAVTFTHTSRPVYNLTVEGEHCYFANGVLTHNCDTVSMALRFMRDRGLLTRAPERMAEIDAGRRHTGKAPAPLYPI